MSLGKESTLWSYRYYFLVGTYIVGTGFAFRRISKQPYVQAIKWEQHETVFKGTTLAAALIGFGLSGGINQRRSAAQDRI